MVDLFTAYLEARKHKRYRAYQQKFEANLNQNLQALTDELYNRTYKPSPATYFIIEDPKKREIFAANFRDRIVHHLYYNYTHELFERTFIADSYSCIKGRGTHYGIQRLEQHIRKASLNYTERAYVLKIDLQGYFMHINRNKLLQICLKTLRKQASKGWAEKIDMDFVEYLTREIILLDPTQNCTMRGKRSDWDNLPHSKSLFHSPPNCGLPIGNLTSQLFSNIYLNELDQMMKRQLHCTHYGRYVDDFYIVSPDRDWLKSLIPIVRNYVSETLDLRIHEGKTQIFDIYNGVEFLGAYLKPHRKYIRTSTLHRIQKKLHRLDAHIPKDKDFNPLKLRDVLSSYGGMLAHWNTTKKRIKLFASFVNVWRFGSFDLKWRKFEVRG